MTTKPLLIIQPATSYDDMPDLCADRGDEVTWFSEACGVPLDQIISVSVYKGEALPDPRDVRGAIITGAIDMVTDNHPWITETADWVLHAIDVGCPLLGVCFGHQLIAHALGGKVGENPNGAAFGNVPVIKPNPEVRDILFDAVPVSTEMKVFHYQSVTALPKGAVVFATGPNDPFYAVRYRDNVWGVQFHPEFDCDIFNRTIDVYANTMAEAGFDPGELRVRNVEDPAGHRLLRRFAELST